MHVAHKEPCKACPWRKISAPGWLGADTPEGFIRHIVAETPLPCHSCVDYEDPEWEAQASDAPYCAGAMQYMLNTGKLPRDHALNQARNQFKRNPEVFGNPMEFIDHHHKLTKGKKQPI